MALAPQGDAEPGISTIAHGVAQSGERGVGVTAICTVDRRPDGDGEEGAMTRRATAVPRTDRARTVPLPRPGERYGNVR